MNWRVRKLYDLFRYDIPRFIKNVVVYRKALWNTYNFDYSGSLHYMREHLERMEPVIRNGNHIHGERTADQVKLCKLLLDRILDCTDQYYFDDIEMVTGKKVGMLVECSFKHTPKYSQAPRNSKYQHKILMSKEKNDWDLLMKMLNRHMRGWWE
jgi:hypothetical protein